MAAHRHWRLAFWCRTVSGVQRMALAEAVFRTVAAGPQVATGGTILANTPEAGYFAADLIDGSTSTLYSVTGVSIGSWNYDFGGDIAIVEVAVTLGRGASPYPGSTHGPEMLRLDWSDDGTNWVPARSVSAPAGWVDGATVVMTVAAPTVQAAAEPGWALSQAPSLAQGLNVAGSVPSMTVDLEDGGTLRIAGTVAIDGTPIVPVMRRVRLHHQLSGRLVREVWSAEDGSFAFEGLRASQYLVITDDHTLLYDPVARDRRVPVP